MSKVENSVSLPLFSVIRGIEILIVCFPMPDEETRCNLWGNSDIWRLMVCDYASGQWWLFLCIDLCILFMLFALVVMRYISVLFNVYIEKYYTFVILLMITLVMEFGVFFFFMIEALSPQVIYFDLETGSMTYLTLIALPIISILLYFLMLKLNKREPVP